MTENGKKISSELQDRLDDFFAAPDKDGAQQPTTAGSNAKTRPVGHKRVEDGSARGNAASPAAASPAAALPAAALPAATPPAATGADAPLLNLQATILSLDWEITDTTLDLLIEEIDRLKVVYHNDKLPFMFLQLLGSIGKYISVKKVKAHPDSIKMLHSVYAGFEKVLRPDVSSHEKKKILSNEVRQFKSLKQRIRRTQPAPDAAVPQAGATSPAVPPEPLIKITAPAVTPPSRQGVGPVDMDALLTEIRKMIRSEFDAFKTELRAMLGNE